MDNQKQELQNATLILVLAIISIPICCCYGIGLVLAIIALVLAIQQTNIAKANTDIVYSNIGTINTGKIIAIIGIVFNSFWLIYLIIFIAKHGFGSLSNPDSLKEILEKYK